MISNKKILKFLNENCKIIPAKNSNMFSSVYSNNGKYITSMSFNNSVITLDDYLIKFFIEHGINKFDDCNDFCNENSNIAKIGYSEKEQTWYGWNYKYICGFNIGDIIKDKLQYFVLQELSGYSKELDKKPDNLPINFKCKTLEDCKKCAALFAQNIDL